MDVNDLIIIVTVHRFWVQRFTLFNFPEGTLFDRANQAMRLDPYYLPFTWNYWLACICKWESMRRWSRH